MSREEDGGEKKERSGKREMASVAGFSHRSLHRIKRRGPSLAVRNPGAADARPVGPGTHSKQSER